MYLLKNCMDEMVANTLKDCMPGSGLCDCEKCRLDVMALALRNLPPLYVVTVKGELFVKINAIRPQYQADVLQAVLGAMQIVKDNPQHDKHD